MFLKKIQQLNKTLLFRLTILYAGIFAVSSLLIMSVFYYRIHSVTMSTMDRELLEDAEDYARLLEEGGIESLKEKIAEESSAEDPGEEFIRVLTPGGVVVASTDTSDWGPLETGSALVRVGSGTASHVFDILTIPGQDFSARMISFTLEPALVLQRGETFEQAEDYLQIFRNWFLVLLIPVTALASLAGWFMAKRAILDMEEVTRTAREISAGSFHRRVRGKDRFSEIENLGDTFNSMLDRIEALLRSMREVNDNIAHDLRSPISRIRGAAEMCLVSGNDYKTMAASTIEECDRLIEMINTMLEITEIQSGITELEFREIDAAQIILDACELFRPLAESKKIILTEDIPGRIPFHGDRKKFQRVVSNLMDNAIKYTPHGGTVTVSAATDENTIGIAFEDTGPGISEADLPHIFERFYRCDRSRTNDGVGLGLSLARAFTEAMKGRISVTVNKGSGCRFVVTFPRELAQSGK
ncbi:MAG: HAMP domain-containing protein [Nitrospiraceae bacterium]|nr:MAG: HAMP domain-containing protein [Nitrospiraceae bacterium]